MFLPLGQQGFNIQMEPVDGEAMKEAEDFLSTPRVNITIWGGVLLQWGRMGTAEMTRGGVEMRMWISSSRCGAGRLEAEQPPWRNGCGESFGERKQGRWQGVETLW